MTLKFSPPAPGTPLPSVEFPSGEMAARLLLRVRERRPRVHCLMNSVVQKFTADGIAALGGIPSMTSSKEEIENFVDKADVLIVNLGTLNGARRKVIHLAVAAARAAGKPWIVDPVHCDYSLSRLAFARDLIALGPSILRGNAAEMAALDPAGVGLRIETGPIDRLWDATRRMRVENGHAWMAQVTGTGCLSGGVIAAFAAVEPDGLAAACAALCVTGVAAELAALHARGPGTFEAAFLDALAALGEADIRRRARIGHDEAR